ncbi:terpene synthase-like protein [Leptotrombidium deliense]|uniref:Terpene synthase n=1 Tax=Leptotrombidium deliense TaxID=299467 RepID=A0A443S1C0_9ACAR|nr:terpene synthase-like protein [Leptotrombidium deliense]
MSTLIKLNIPRFTSPFETNVSKFEDVVHQAVRKWWTQMGIVTNKEEVDHLINIDSVGISCRSIPDATLEEQFVFASTIFMTEAISKGEKIEPKDALEKAGMDVQEDALRYYKNQMPLLRRNLNYFFRSNQWEMKVNRRHRIPTLGEYCAIRNTTISFYLIIDMFEPLGGIELPIEFRGRTPIRELYDATLKINWTMNDILSLSKELKDNCSANLVIVLKNELQCDWQTAVEEAYKMHEEAVQEFLIAEKLLVETGDQNIDNILAKYVQFLKNVLSSQYYFYNNTDRYGNYTIIEVQ